MNSKLYFILAILSFYSCKRFNNIDIGNSKIISFDKTFSKSFNLIVQTDSVNTTFLEYNKDHLIGEIKNFKISDNYILILDGQYKFFIFNKDGDLISATLKRGKGPSEYVAIEDFTLDFNEKYLYFLDPYNSKVLKYNITGEFIKEYSIPLRHATHISKLGNENFAIYQSARFSDDLFNIYIYDNNFHLIKAIKDFNGYKIKRLPYLLDVCWYEFNNITFFKEVMSDTVFAISNDGSVTPHFIIDFDNKKMPTKNYTKTELYQSEAHKYYQIGSIIESNYYIFFNIIFYNNSNFFVYDKNNKKLYNLGINSFNNSQFGTYWPNYIDNKDCMYSFSNSIEFSNHFLSYIINDEIQQNLTINDNPILLSCKLRKIKNQ